MQGMLKWQSVVRGNNESAAAPRKRFTTFVRGPLPHARNGSVRLLLTTCRPVTPRLRRSSLKTWGSDSVSDQPEGSSMARDVSCIMGG